MSRGSCLLYMHASKIYIDENVQHLFEMLIVLSALLIAPTGFYFLIQNGIDISHHLSRVLVFIEKAPS